MNENEMNESVDVNDITEIMEPASTGNDAQSEKMFTQSELNEIVRKRIDRERKKSEEKYSAQLDALTAAAAADIAAREAAVERKEYLITNGLPLDLVDIVNAATESEFETKVNQLAGMFRPKQTAPAYNPEPVDTGEPRSDIRSAFSPDAKHKPKSWY